MGRKIIHSLNSEMGRLLLGFLLTGVIGAILAQWLQDRSWSAQRQLELEVQERQWERDRRFEMLRRKLDRGEAALKELSDLMALRVFRLREAFALSRVGDAAGARRAWNRQLETTEQWNARLSVFQHDVRQLVGAEMSLRLNNYETDDPPVENPVSIHGMFYVAHQRVQRAVRCAETKCSAQSELADTQTHLNALELATDGFVDQASEVFLQNTARLEAAKVQ
jgi:hypothetical protein